MIGAEILSRFIDCEDRRTAPLFGDGAGALVVSLDADGEIGPFVLGSDGAAAGTIQVTRERRVLEMQGHETFLAAVEHMSSATLEVLELAGLQLADVDLFVYHQANGRILSALADRLGVEHERVFDCIAKLGNTSAASVPLALGEAVRVGALKPGDTRRPRRRRRRPRVGRHRDDLGRLLVSAVSAAGERQGCALVTGASRGIGSAIACALAAEGWPVAVNFRSGQDAAAEVVKRIQDDGGRALAVGADVTAQDQLDSLFEHVEQELGRVLVLVNNAGVRADDLALSLTDSDWDSVIDTNLTGAFRTTRRALRGMIRERFGRVINVASVVGPRANAGQSNYAAAKAGLIGMTKTIAVEVARRGVTVNAIAPGLIDTDMTADLDGELLGAVPARRAGTPEEVAACACFLASEQAGYVTGSTLYVDGGLAA